MSDPTHSLVLGPSKSGKSTLAFALARAARRDGLGVLVLDPKMDADWEPSADARGRRYLTDDADRFLWWARNATCCALFVDEAGAALARDAKYDWLTAQARAWGHHTYVIAQMYTMVRPALRINCDEVYTFRQDPDSAEQIARQFTDKNLSAAQDLGQYQYLHKRPFEPLKLQKLKL